MEKRKQVSLIACPSEIIFQIVGNLDRSSLSRLALSSRLLNVIFTPYLYDHIELLGHSQNRSRPESIDFRNLTLLLLERPHLAGYVQHFSMRNNFFGREVLGEHTETAHLPQALLTAIEAASHSKEEERQWLKDVSFTKSINEDALMALLLPTLRNLKTLDLRLGDDIIYFSRMMQRASRKERPFDTTPAFEKLSDIMYAQNKLKRTDYDEEFDGDDEDDDDNGNDEHPYNTAMPLPLPAVTRIFGLKSSFERGISKQEPWVLPLACGFSSQLSHLELRDCLFNSQTLVDLLRVPTALKTFIYEVNPKTPDSHVININIYKAMEHQMSSLENIWLDYVPWNQELKRFRQLCYSKPMPSFANFNNLRTLRIASPFLFGYMCLQQREGKTHLLAPLLPESLETLHITRCDHNCLLICDELELLLVRLTNTTHLRKIIIENPYMGRGGKQGPIITYLADLAEGKNISLSAVNGGPEDHADDWYDWKGLGIDGSLPWAEAARGDSRSYPEKVFDVQSKSRTLPPFL